MVDHPSEGDLSLPPHRDVGSSASSVDDTFETPHSIPTDSPAPISPSVSPPPGDKPDSGPFSAPSPDTTTYHGFTSRKPSQDDNATLAALAARSSSDLIASSDEMDANTPSFLLVASLRSQITDLSSQVTSLNSKLVSSYTRIGDLEDDLHDATDDVVRLRARVNQLEQERVKWEKEIEVGGWVERDHVQGEMQRLMYKVLEETKSRETAVQAHSQLETEIENLTSSLFAEANKMVAVERYARARAEEKMRSLEESNTVMLGLFDDLQENLRDNVEKLEEKENEIATLQERLDPDSLNYDEEAGEKGSARAISSEIDLTAPTALFSDGTQVVSANGSSSHLPTRPSLTGAGSRSFIHQSLPPRLNTSVVPYTEFIAFVTYLRQLRVAVLSRPPPEHLSQQHPFHTPASRGFGANAHSYNQTSIGAIAPPVASPAQLLAPQLPLSTHISQPFLKRCIEEDSDPSLRLDLAPGLGLFSRRTVGTAIVDGTLLIEPTFSGSTLPSSTCTLCGANLERWWTGGEIPVQNTAAANVNQTMRKVLGGGGWSISTFTGRAPTPPPRSNSVPPSPVGNEPPTPTRPFPHQQIHIFRVNDTSTSRYAICPSYCLPRLRAVCEFWTYVRAIERGLLLEEGFHFVGGKGVNGSLGSSSKNPSLPSLGGGRSKTNLNDGPKEVERGAPAGRKTVDVVLETEVDEPTNLDELHKDVESKMTPLSEPPSSPALISTPSLPSNKSDHSPVTLQKPPVPKRSEARPTTPILGSGEFNPPPPTQHASSNLASTEPTTLPEAVPFVAAGPPSKLPPRPPSAPVGSTVHKSISAGARASDLGGTVDAMEIVGGATGWEDRCWSEVVRLKEAVFWTRMARVEVEV